MTAWTAVVVDITIVPAHENKPWNNRKYSDNKKLVEYDKECQNEKEEIHKRSKQDEVEKFYQSVSHWFDRNDKPPEGPGDKLWDREEKKEQNNRDDETDNFGEEIPLSKF